MKNHSKIRLRRKDHRPLWLWWECLQRGKYDETSPLWNDFGPLGDDFERWRFEHRFLFHDHKTSRSRFFTEPVLIAKEMAKAEELLLNAKDHPWYDFVAFDPSAPKDWLIRRFAEQVDARKAWRGIEKKAGKPQWEQGKARYNFAGPVDCPSIETMLAVWDVNKAQPNILPYEIASKVGIGKIVKGAKSKQVVSAEQDAQTREVKRYLKKANNLIANAVQGVFPKHS